MQLKEKFIKRKAKLGVIGLGYVGLPLCIEMAKAGFEVTGIDVDREKVEQVNSGVSYILDVKNKQLSGLIKSKKLVATTQFETLKKLDAVSICVPTPLRKTKDPDISFILSAVDEIKKYLHKNQLIVLESTTYPGTTNEIILPELEKSGLNVGRDFYLAFSPERVDPGNKHYTTRNTPKIVGGITKECTKIAKLLYEQFIDNVIPVSSTQSAEMVKLLENTFRSVNIGMVNEMVLMCNKLNLNVWEVIDAAATKPFGYMPFYPGPGLGGHCIPIDPHYLSWKLKTLNYNARFIELAGEVNSYMPQYVVDKVIEGLNGVKKSVNGSKILILGVAYKKDISDVRESPSLDVINLLRLKGADICYNDPYVPELKLDNLVLKSTRLSANSLKDFDCVVIITNHSAYNYKWVARNSRLILDTRNALKSIKCQEKIITF